MTQQDLARTVAEVAATRVHKLAPYLVSGEHEISPAQFHGIMSHLRGCPARPTPEENVARHEAYQVEAEHARRAAGPVFGDIPAGFYATPSRTGTNDFDFWKVTEGRKESYRFAKRVLGGGDERYPRLEPVSRPEQVLALRAILAFGVQKSAEGYADNQQRCMKCGAQLTDEESRAAKMGPVCRGDR